MHMIWKLQKTQILFGSIAVWYIEYCQRKNIYYMKLTNSPLCNFCNEEEDTFLHAFLNVNT